MFFSTSLKQHVMKSQIYRLKSQNEKMFQKMFQFSAEKNVFFLSYLKFTKRNQVYKKQQSKAYITITKMI